MMEIKDGTGSPSSIKLESVYELASDISEHLKTLIDGVDLPESSPLIPTVVQVLVHLEQIVLERDSYALLIDQLHHQIQQLKNENAQRIKQQMKYFSDIEDIDETWRKENVQLSQYVQLLKKENLRLSSSLKSNEKFYYSLTDLKEEPNQDEADQIKKNELDKLNNELRRKSKEIDLKNEEIDSLQTQNDNLLNENQNLQVLLALLPSSKNVAKRKETPKASTINQDELESRIKQLESELDKLRLLQLQQEQQPDCDNNNGELEEVEVAQEVFAEFACVQGPIPEEPADKLHCRSSRIWSLFKYFRKP